MNNVVPDLIGRVCTRLVCQQYWHEGELAEEANVTFLQVDAEQWHRFLIDWGEPFWKVVDGPDKWNTTPMDEFHCPQIELAGCWGLVGRTIGAAGFVQIDRASEFRIVFSGGLTLVLHNNEDDRNTLYVRASAAHV